MTARSIRLIPAELYQEPTCHRAVRLWCVLVDLAREDATVTMPPATLATVLGWSLATVRRRRDALVAAGWLEVTAGGGRGHVATWTPLRRPCLADVKAIAAEDEGDVEEYVW